MDAQTITWIMIIGFACGTFAGALGMAFRSYIFTFVFGILFSLIGKAIALAIYLPLQN